jgi:hypothetical protein
VYPTLRITNHWNSEEISAITAALTELGLRAVTVLALIENDQCCSLKVTTLARVQGSAM